MVNGVERCGRVVRRCKALKKVPRTMSNVEVNCGAKRVVDGFVEARAF